MHGDKIPPPDVIQNLVQVLRSRESPWQAEVMAPIDPRPLIPGHGMVWP